MDLSIHDPKLNLKAVDLGVINYKLNLAPKLYEKYVAKLENSILEEVEWELLRRNLNKIGSKAHRTCLDEHSP